MRNIASSLSGMVEWKRKASDGLPNWQIASLLPRLTIWHDKSLHWSLRGINRFADGWGGVVVFQVNQLTTFDLTVKQELQRLASLQENWDSQGARSIDPEIVAAAGDFVSTLPSRLKSRIAVPAVVPMRKGNLQFEWHNGPRTLELEVEDPWTIHYLKWHSEAGIEEEVCSITDADTVIGLIEWFAKG